MFPILSQPLGSPFLSLAPPLIWWTPFPLSSLSGVFMSHSTLSNWAKKFFVWASAYLLYRVVSPIIITWGSARVRDVLSNLGKGLKYTCSSNEVWGLTFTFVSSFPFFFHSLPILSYPPRRAWKDIPNLIGRLAHSTDWETFSICYSVTDAGEGLLFTPPFPRKSFSRIYSGTHLYPPLLPPAHLFTFKKVYLCAHGMLSSRQSAGGMSVTVLLVVVLFALELTCPWNGFGKRKSLRNGSREGHK